MKSKFVASLSLATAVVCLFFSQVDIATSAGPRARDPGQRFGPPGAGDRIDGLSANEIAFFEQGKEDFA